jgi:hypothetical protein
MQFYNGSLLISAPIRRPCPEVWIPYAFVSWLQRRPYQFHHLPELRTLTSFTEEEAPSGISVSRSWTALRVLHIAGSVGFRRPV